MNIFLLLITIYLSYLIIWFILNLVFYFISIIFKSPKPSTFINSLGLIVIYLLNFAVGLGLLWFGILLLLNGEILWLVVYIFVGAGLLSTLFNFFQLPFIFITGYFLEKIENSNLGVKNEGAISLENKANIIDVIDNEERLLKKMATYFISLYALSLLHIIFIAKNWQNGWGWYILSPFLDIVLFSFFLGIPYGIYNKITGKSFFTKNKKYFFVNIWRVSFFLYLMMIIITLIIDS